VFYIREYKPESDPEMIQYYHENVIIPGHNTKAFIKSNTDILFIQTAVKEPGNNKIRIAYGFSLPEAFHHPVIIGGNSEFQVI